MDDLKQIPTDFSAWVPKPARAMLQRYYGCQLPIEQSVITLQHVIKRLATRPEMEEMWAKLRTIGPMQPDDFVECVLASWFAANVRLVWKNKREGYYDFGCKQIADKVTAFIAELGTLPRFPNGKDITNRRIDELKQLAAFHRARSRKFRKAFASIPPIGKVHYSGAGYPLKPLQRAFVRTLASLLKRKTRKPCYPLVATVTNLVFDTNLGARDVAKWCAKLKGEDSSKTRQQKSGESGVLSRV